MTDLFKILSDETRLRILMLLKRQDLCVCELVNLMDISQPNVSKHMAPMRNLGIVASERNEQYVYYRLNRDYPGLIDVLDTVEPWMASTFPFHSDLAKLSHMDDFVCQR
jgi:ArsR family transcriptional regulator